MRTQGPSLDKKSISSSITEYEVLRTTYQAHNPLAFNTWSKECQSTLVETSQQSYETNLLGVSLNTALLAGLRAVCLAISWGTLQTWCASRLTFARISDGKRVVSLVEFGLRRRLSFTLLMQEVCNGLARSASEDRMLSICRRMSLFFPYRGHWHPQATLRMFLCHHTDGILFYARKPVNENCPMLGIGCGWNSVKEDSGEWADGEALPVRFSRHRSCWILRERMKKNIGQKCSWIELDHYERAHEEVRKDGQYIYTVRKVPGGYCLLGIF